MTKQAKIKPKEVGAKKKKKSKMPQQNTDGEAHEISSDELVREMVQQANPPIPSSEDSNSLIGTSNITTEMSASSNSAEVPGKISGRGISVAHPAGEQKIVQTRQLTIVFFSKCTS